jgi:hypothetical protein
MKKEYKWNQFNNLIVTGSHYPSITMYAQKLSVFTEKKGLNETVELNTLASNKIEHNKWEIGKTQIKTFPGYFLLAAEDNYILYGIQNDLLKNNNAFTRWFGSKTKKSELSTIYKATILNDEFELNNLNAQKTLTTQISIDLNALKPGAVSANTSFFIDSVGTPYVFYSKEGEEKQAKILNEHDKVKTIIGKPYIVNYNNKEYIIYFIRAPNRASYCYLTIEPNNLNNLNIIEHSIAANMFVKAHTYDTDSKTFYVVTGIIQDTTRQQDLIVLPLKSIISE